MRIRRIVSSLLHRNAVKAKSLTVPLFSVIFIASTIGNLKAQDNSADSDFTQRAYVNGGIGVTRLEPVSPSVDLTVSDDSDAGGHLGFGFDLNRFLAVEAYIADLGEAGTAFQGADTGTIGYRVFGLSAIGYLFNSRSRFSLIDSDVEGLFRREGLSLFGRAGVGHMRNSSDRVDYHRDYPSHAVFGLGLEYGFENGVALRTELMGMDTDARYLNVGVLKRFGDVSVPTSVVPAAALPAEPVPKDVPEPTPEVDIAEPVIPPTIYFEFDRSELTAEAQQKLDIFAESMKNEDREMMVGGHTDWIAPERYNISLSLRRAEAVVNYLVASGLDGQQMTMMGYGESRPISNNNTANGRALNRRTEIRIR